MGCVYFCTAGASIDLSVSVYNQPRDASITVLSMHVTGLLVSVYNHLWDASISASIDLSVSVYNHLRDASITALSICVLVYWFWSTIFHGILLFLRCWCDIGTSVLVYTHPRNSSISALLVHLSMPRLLVIGLWVRSTII